MMNQFDPFGQDLGLLKSLEEEVTDSTKSSQGLAWKSKLYET